MNDGDGRDRSKLVSERETHQFNRRIKKNKSGGDEFAQAIARIAAAQVCEGLGFQSFHQSALDTLADVGVRYIKEIGKTATSFANSANRSQSNVFDVIQGLVDLGSVQGFSGASDVNHSLSGSGVVKDLIRYVNKSDETPFTYLIPVFPLVKERLLITHSFQQLGQTPPGEHIPSWLPKFPDPATYLSPRVTKDSESPRTAGRPFLNFQHKLANGYGSEAGLGELGQEKNPFLAPPLQCGEKELSLPVIPAKLLDDVAGYRKISDALEPSLKPLVMAVEHEKDSLEPEDRRKVILNGRPTVQFKFGNGKRFLERGEKVSIWFGDYCDVNGVTKEKDDMIICEDDGVTKEKDDTILCEDDRVTKEKDDMIICEDDGVTKEKDDMIICEDGVTKEKEDVIICEDDRVTKEKDDMILCKDDGSDVNEVTKEKADKIICEDEGIMPELSQV